MWIEDMFAHSINYSARHLVMNLGTNLQDTRLHVYDIHRSRNAIVALSVVNFERQMENRRYLYTTLLFFPNTGIVNRTQHHKCNPAFVIQSSTCAWRKSAPKAGCLHVERARVRRTGRWQIDF